MSNTRKATYKPLIVISRSKLKLQRRLAQEYNEQRAARVRQALEKAADLQEKCEAEDKSRNFVWTDEMVSELISELNGGISEKG